MEIVYRDKHSFWGSQILLDLLLEFFELCKVVIGKQDATAVAPEYFINFQEYVKVDARFFLAMKKVIKKFVV